MTPFLALLGLLACTPAQDPDETGNGDTGAPPLPDALPAVEGTLTSENTAGRHGSFYLPEGFNQAPLPLLVGFHGTGGDGAQVVGAFREDADREGFGIVAPDSRVSPDGQYTWQVATEPGPPSEDLLFAQTCLEEVLAMEGLVSDPSHLLSAGFSGGGSSGPYLATNDDRFTHCAVLHGGVFPGGLGSNVVPCWFSTGSEDTVRSPSHVQGQAQSMEDAGFPDVVYEEFPGGHDLGPEERAALTAWWLRGAV